MTPVHAGRCIINAIRGLWERPPDDDWGSAGCGADFYTPNNRVLWSVSGGVWADDYSDTEYKEDPKQLKDINCNHCLKLVREAMDPVRYDWAVTKGLIKEPT